MAIRWMVKCSASSSSESRVMGRGKDVRVTSGPKVTLCGPAVKSLISIEEKNV